jgi:hypothetical protein
VKEVAGFEGRQNPSKFVDIHSQKSSNLWAIVAKNIKIVDIRRQKALKSRACGGRGRDVRDGFRAQAPPEDALSQVIIVLILMFLINCSQVILFLYNYILRLVRR